MRISDWSSDVCSSDLDPDALAVGGVVAEQQLEHGIAGLGQDLQRLVAGRGGDVDGVLEGITAGGVLALDHAHQRGAQRSEEHTSELQSLMRISYAVFCLKKKITTQTTR